MRESQSSKGFYLRSKEPYTLLASKYSRSPNSRPKGIKKLINY